MSSKTLLYFGLLIATTACLESSANTLTVEVFHNGAAGRVSSSPAGISCTAGTCTGDFTAGTKVVLTATPQVNEHIVCDEVVYKGQGKCPSFTNIRTISIFAGWLGACSNSAPTCTVDMSSNKFATALFADPALPGEQLFMTSVAKAVFALRNHSFVHDVSDRFIYSLPKGTMYPPSSITVAILNGGNTDLTAHVRFLAHGGFVVSDDRSIAAKAVRSYTLDLRGFRFSQASIDDANPAFTDYYYALTTGYNGMNLVFRVPK